MEPYDLALSEVHVSEHHQILGTLEIDTCEKGLQPQGMSQASVLKLTATTEYTTPDNVACNTSNNAMCGSTNRTSSALETPSLPDSDTHCNSRSDMCLQAPSVAGPETQAGYSHSQTEYEVCRTRFVFESPGCMPPGSCSSTPPGGSPIYDDDGDLVVRRVKRHTDVIYIDHTLGTRLVHVGLQVWQGCLLLCDFILDRHLNFHDVTALELGGGVGLASVVMATAAKKVICTDTGNSVLAMCQRNLQTNQHLYKHSNSEHVYVRELDWTKQELPQGPGTTYQWRPEDLDLLDDVSVLFAADVVYDPDLTEAFLTTVLRLMSKPPLKVLYLALERRLNFTLDGLEVACPAYDHFLACLDELNCHQGAVGLQLVASQLDTDFPQRFAYTRTQHLVIWKISSSSDVT